MTQLGAPQDRFRKLDQARFDVVVIGSGIGGLTAAALLAQHGRSVLVLDQHYVPGGNASVFRRPGYEFDIGIHYLGQCGPRGAIPRILSAAGAKGVRFNAMDPDGFDTLFFPDFEFRVPAGIEEYSRRLVSTFPAEKPGIQRYISLLQQMRTLQKLPGQPGRALSVLPRSLRALRWSFSTVAKFLDTCTENQKLRAVLCAESGDYAQPPSRASLALHAGLMAHYLESGAYYPRGGGQVMSEALAKSIESRAGKLLLNTRVQRIVVENGRACGVIFANKHVGTREVRAETVISNADIKRTLLELLPEGAIAKQSRRKAQKWEMSLALGVVYLGVRSEIFRSTNRATNYWVYSSYNQEPEYLSARSGEFSDKPFAYVSVASHKDSGNDRLAPPGIVNLQVMGLAPSSPKAWGISESDATSNAYRKNPAYLQKKAVFAKRLLQTAERALPGIGQNVVFQEVATPLTHQRYTGATGGTSYGLALTPEQFLHRRPSAKSPVPGLLYAGASTRMGHGIMGSMMSGVAAAAEILGSKLFKEVIGALPKTNSATTATFKQTLKEQA